MTVATEDLRVLHRATGLTDTEYVVPSEALADLPPGARIIWQVRARPAAGGPVIEGTFTSLVD